jgi:NCAIR mutase (PurE)-related protein
VAWRGGVLDKLVVGVVLRVLDKLVVGVVVSVGYGQGGGVSMWELGSVPIVTFGWCFLGPLIP